MYVKWGKIWCKRVKGKYRERDKKAKERVRKGKERDEQEYLDNSWDKNAFPSLVRHKNSSFC